MENKLYATTKRKRENIINLFPNYFKKIGITLMLVGLIPAGIISQVDLTLVKVIPKDVVKLITIDLFLLGLLFVAWAKDKVEDEMTMLMRLKAIEWTFMWAVLFVIIEPIFNRIFQSDVLENMNGKALVVCMLVVYLTQYYYQKKAR